MNDPNKRIDVNLSSLLSLKAELLRKHEEVSKAKSSHLVENFVPRKGEKHSEKRTKSKNTTTTTTETNSETLEDSELLNRSKKILEAKSKFYDKMSATGGSLNSDENCLVMFNQKKQIGGTSSQYESSDSSSSDDSETESCDNVERPGEWVEYTDCLGRTRKCLKEDVEFFKKKDGELAETVAERNKSNGVEVDPPKWFLDTKGDFRLPMQVNDATKDDDTMSMLSKSSKIDEIRQNWEKQEAENVNKDYVHYQGVLFDEARTHGVGYYAFSTDDSERAKQQKELEAIRLKTLTSQKERENQRMSREKIIAERVKAAKNRQRARLGLPPLEDNPEPTEQELFDKTAEEKRKKKEEKAKRKKEQEEKLRDSERKKHIRPWDKDKIGVRKVHESDDDSGDDEEEKEWTYKPEREPMSQEQWNERERSKRNMEFAPMPTETVARHSNNPFNQPSHQFYEDCENKTLNFTTKKRKPFVVRHVDKPAVTPIHDELIDNYIAISRRGAEIAPPANLDDADAPVRKQKRTETTIESSIEAGLRYLREQSDKGTLSTKMTWTSNADY